ncbi:glutathione S-transferase [Psychromonas marina]|uniref:Glutathione S-transferase n=1 Tax=Psychromonas marina TaxID=88364 RepID=A0ABQ6E1T0_9GAMM|nr:glutathione S-transferase [Psychromonas marina]GLS91402.1 glutathione S-transferase [Psychromonas marina]
MATPSLPILYSLQNCPYAIRARFTLFKSQQQVLIRAIKLNNKPSEMLAVSPKGSVPVLVVADDEVIEESLEIMHWALTKNDPDDLLHHQTIDALNAMDNLIIDFESTFIPALEHYCCAKRYHEDNIEQCRSLCESVLMQLENKLSRHAFIFSEKESLVDIALFPFIRKFARVERQWYLQSPYPNLRNWLNNYLQSPTFTKVMTKHELWLEKRKTIYFPG